MAETPDTVDDALDALSSPTTAEIIADVGTRGFSDRELAAAAAARALAAAGGGDGSLLQILGPFTVNWDDAGVNNAPIAKADLTVGTTVIRAWAIITADWATDEGDAFQFVLEVGDATDDSQTNASVVDYPSVVGHAAVGDGGAGNPSDYVYRTALVSTSGWKLWASVWVNGSGALLAGSIDFYTLVNLPA